MLVRFGLQVALYGLPLLALALLVLWPLVEQRLIRPLICEAKLRSYFGTSDVHIDRVRVKWDGLWLALHSPTITLECHDTRVG